MINEIKTCPHVFVAMSNVMAKLCMEGIAKENKNIQQGYNFRGIDAVYNALAPFLAEEKLLILPHLVRREVTEETTKHGTKSLRVVVFVDFYFTSGIDGSQHIIPSAGEASDTSDKATNKALTAAFKYMCLIAFCIPTKGDNDADSTNHEFEPTNKPTPTTTTNKTNPTKPTPLTQEEIVLRFRTKLQTMETITDLEKFVKDSQPFISKLSSSGIEAMQEDIYNQRSNIEFNNSKQADSQEINSTERMK